MKIVFVFFIIFLFYGVSFAQVGKELNVLDFGAKGDGITDDTKAFQNALDEAGKTGTVVKVPAGKFVIMGNLFIPQNVTLEGVAKAPAARATKPFGYLKEVGQIIPDTLGTWLLAYGGRNEEDGKPFIHMLEESSLVGINVFYPEQTEDNIVPYPWTIRGQGDNISLINVNLLNPYKAVDFGTFNCGRHYVKGLYGQPIKTGIWIDKCFDVGRLEDVHFWPFWSDKAMADFSYKNGTAFVFGRTDWEFVNNSFCIGYNIGFHYASFGSNAPHVLMTNSGSDGSGIAAALIEATQVHCGLQFTNCVMNGRVVIGKGSIGPIMFTNSLFYPYYSFFDKKNNENLPFDDGCFINNQGQNRLYISNSHFYWAEPPFLQDDYYKNIGNRAAIYSDGIGLSINNCDFTAVPKSQIRLGKNSKSVIISNSVFRNGLKINNLSKSKPKLNGNIEE